MFKGRISVGDFWKAFVLLLGIDLIIAFSTTHISQNPPSSLGLMFLWLIPLLVVAIAVACVGVGLLVRRLHDLGRSGWLILILPAFGILSGLVMQASASANGYPGPLAMVVEGLVLLLYLIVACWPGSPEGNAYGAPAHYASWWAALIGKKSS